MVFSVNGELVTGNMGRSEGKCLFKRLHPMFFSLTRKTIHKVNAEIVNPVFRDEVNASLAAFCRMSSLQKDKLLIVE